ncbi:hypothetical protein [Azospirillum melinis]
MLARFHDLFTLLAGRLGGGSRPPLPDLGGWPDFGTHWDCALRHPAGRRAVFSRSPWTETSSFNPPKDRPDAEHAPVLVVDSSRRL